MKFTSGYVVFIVSGALALLAMLVYFFFSFPTS